jgi:hypothetical protein
MREPVAILVEEVFNCDEGKWLAVFVEEAVDFPTPAEIAELNARALLFDFLLKHRNTLAISHIWHS